MKTNEAPKITAWLPDIVGKGYGTFWNCKKRYRVVKGSRMSKKFSIKNELTYAILCAKLIGDETNQRHAERKPNSF